MLSSPWYDKSDRKVRKKKKLAGSECHVQPTGPPLLCLNIVKTLIKQPSIKHSTSRVKETNSNPKSFNALDKA